MFTSKERQRQRTGKHGTSRDDYLQVMITLCFFFFSQEELQANFNLLLLFLFKTTAGAGHRIPERG